MILIIFITVSGCSSGKYNQSPTMPDQGQTTSEQPLQLSDGDREATSMRTLLVYSMVYVDITDPGNIVAEVIPLRNSAIHLNILKLLEVGPCTTCFKIVGFNIPEPGVLDVDIQITHPFPDLNFTAFDVRGIMMFNASHQFPALGLSTSDIQLDDFAIVNAEGYTALYNGSTMGMSGDYQVYFKGKIATETVPDALLNGYLRHNSANPSNTRNALYAADAVTRTYSLNLSSSQTFVFGYAVDANWAVPLVDPVIDPMTDFGLDASSPEPWNVIITELGPGLNETGGETDLQIDVYDWQDAMAAPPYTHFAPVIECPELFTGTKTANWLEDGGDYARYIVTINNTSLALEGEYLCLIAVEDEDNSSSPTWLDLTAYQTIEVPVTEIYPCNEIEPNDVSEDANAIESGCLTHGTMCGGDNVDVWTFTLSSAGTVDFYLDHDEYTPNVFSWVLTGPSGIEDSDFDAPSPISKSWDLSAGTYYIMLMGTIDSCFEYWFTCTGDFDEPECSESEPNDNSGEADIIQSECITIGDICSGDNVDVWTFTLSSSGTVDFDLDYDEQTSGDFSWTLTGPSGIEDSDFDAPSPVSASWNLDAATYYVMLMGTVGSCYEYTFTVNY